MSAPLQHILRISQVACEDVNVRKKQNMVVNTITRDMACVGLFVLLTAVHLEVLGQHT